MSLEQFNSTYHTESTNLFRKIYCFDRPKNFLKILTNSLIHDSVCHWLLKSLENLGSRLFGRKVAICPCENNKLQIGP